MKWMGTRCTQALENRRDWHPQWGTGTCANSVKTNCQIRRYCHGPSACALLFRRGLPGFADSAVSMLLLSAMVFSAIFSHIMADGKLSFKMHMEFQRQQRTFVPWAPKRKDLLVMAPPFAGLFWDSRVRVVTSHCHSGTKVKSIIQGEI